MDDIFHSGVSKILVEAYNSKENKEYMTALNKYKEALFFLEGEEKIDVLFLIGDLYSEIEDYENALLAYKEILKLDDRNSGAWYGMAYTNEFTGGDLDKTLEAYEKAIEIDDKYTEAYYYASIIYGDRGDFLKAKEYLEKIISLNPEDFIAYNDLGAIYESLGKLDEAKKHLLQSIKINDNYHLSHFNLGVVYKEMGKFEDAIIEYKKSAKLSNERNPYLNMSALYIENDRLDEAEDILTEGIKKLEDHILYYNRACVYRKKGKINHAIEDFNKAKKIDPVVLEWGIKDPDLMDIIAEE